LIASVRRQVAGAPPSKALLPLELVIGATRTADQTD
jgi:hypothetical protein